jgi:hypothetical protein
VSWDLGIWADPGGRYEEDPHARYEAICESRDADAQSSELAALIAELEQRWPGGSDEDFESSPWATWPLTSNATPSGVVLNFTYSTPVPVIEAVVRAALDVPQHRIALVCPRKKAFRSHQ